VQEIFKARTKETVHATSHDHAHWWSLTPLTEI